VGGRREVGRQYGDDVEGDKTGEDGCRGDYKEAFLGCEIASSQHDSRYVVVGDLVFYACNEKRQKPKMAKGGEEEEEREMKHCYAAY